MNNEKPQKFDLPEKGDENWNWDEPAESTEVHDSKPPLRIYTNPNKKHAKTEVKKSRNRMRKSSRKINRRS